MSDLLMALIALGVLIIVGVVVYNWLQERKLRKNIAEDFIVPQKDVLAEEFYIDADAYVDKELAGTKGKAKLIEKLNQTEPKLENETTANLPKVEDILPEFAQVTPVAEAKPNLEVEPKVEAPPPIEKTIQIGEKPNQNKLIEDIADTVSLPSDLHPQIDLTAFLFATKRIDVKTVNKMVEEISKDMGVTMMVHGLDSDNKWHACKAVDTEGTFKQLACSLQLADRGGPVAKHLLNKFQFAVENMGLELGAHVEWQGAGDAMQRAIDLDKFCMEVDQLVSVHLLQGETPVHGTKLRGLAEASGMRLEQDGKFYFYAATQPDTPLFLLASTDRQPFTSEGLRNTVVMGATFQMEIPKVESCEQVFSQMIQIAQKMANSLGARMVDDNQKPLGDLQIEKIRRQLKVIHATMLARGVMPGSPSSARLFN